MYYLIQHFLPDKKEERFYIIPYILFSCTSNSTFCLIKENNFSAFLDLKTLANIVVTT